MKDLVIFGAGPIAELAAFYFQEDHGRYATAFTVDAAYRTHSTFLERPVYAFEEIERYCPPETCDLFVAVSYTGLNTLRRARVDAAKAKGYNLASYVSSRATRFSTFTPADNQFVLENTTIQPFARVGRNVTLWSGVHVGHHSTIGEDCFLAPNVAVSGGVTIGPRCFIGVNATIRNHVTIGADCVIGAGALVLSDVPNGAVLSPGGTKLSKVPSHRLRRI